jgi:four helix bundle protein
MTPIQRFEDPVIWQLADKINKNPDFRFTEQMKSAAGCIMDNIAEGFERNSRTECLSALSISQGEAAKLKSQLYRAKQDNYTDKDKLEDLYQNTDPISGKIAGFKKYLNSSAIHGLKFKNRTPNKPKTINKKPLTLKYTTCIP